MFRSQRLAGAGAQHGPSNLHRKEIHHDPDRHQSHNVALTPVAATKVRSRWSRRPDDLVMRIAVQPGGCSGLINQLYFDGASSTATRPRISRRRG